MPTRNVNLTEHFDRFIKTGIKTGRFSNASEVVREGLRLLEQREQEDKAKLEWLRAAAKEGFDAADRAEDEHGSQREADKAVRMGGGACRGCRRGSRRTAEALPSGA